MPVRVRPTLPFLMTKYQKYYKTFRLKALAKLGRRCIKCKESDARCLQIAHKKPIKRKTRTSYDSGAYLTRDVNKLSITMSKKKYKLLCANCHAEEHYEHTRARRESKRTNLINS